MKPMRTGIVCALLAVLAAPSPAAPSPGDQALAGRWTGIGRERHDRFDFAFPVDLEIAPAGDRLMLTYRDRYRGNPRPVAVRTIGKRFTADFPAVPSGRMRISGTLSSDGRALSFRIDGDGMTSRETRIAVLHRGTGALRQFQVPRRQSDGQRETNYSYRAPVVNRDGIPVSTAAAEGVDPGRLEALVRHVLTETGDLAAPMTQGVLVLRNGKLILEEYFWGETAANPHIVSSCAKSVAAIVAGIAWDEGKVDLDRRFASYFDGYADTPWVRDGYPITVRNVLSMDTGTEWNDSAASGSPSLASLGTSDIVRFMFLTKAVSSPGSLFNYNNGLASMLAPFIRHATGQRYEDFVERTLFKPLGIANYRWTWMKEGVPLAAGGLYMTPRAMAKIGQTMLDGGTWHGRRIVSAAWVRESTRQQTGPGDYPYGFYWHLFNGAGVGARHVDGLDGYAAIGQGGQLITVVPKEKLVVIVTASNWAMKADSRAAGTPFGLINSYIVPAVRTGAD